MMCESNLMFGDLMYFIEDEVIMTQVLPNDLIDDAAVANDDTNFIKLLFLQLMNYSKSCNNNIQYMRYYKKNIKFFLLVVKNNQQSCKKLKTCLLQNYKKFHPIVNIEPYAEYHTISVIQKKQMLELMKSIGAREREILQFQQFVDKIRFIFHYELENSLKNTDLQMLKFNLYVKLFKA